ncbi:hypothetical protein L3Q65_38040 [Amycolatopsis sp. FU40]|uniref:hypothetical protein n=1 Tax=Amycolatopsis sp. FU40 TaxID=2914159 RepID=UPI001F2D66A0|nr:hypothetical protein [Amycolatopsis sp. FU40]UKD53647.1 hypothetical protein L3Q65_38040 [Amycolatopsis sp. FU40]
MTSYGVRARVLPVLLVVIPMAYYAVVLVPISVDWRGLGGIPFAALVAFVVDQLGRDRGQRLQSSLWDSWGGPPTTKLLRHREGENNPILLEKRHAALRAKTAVLLPDRDQELASPDDADAKYEAAVSIIRTLTYDRKKFPLVFIENCNYGFRRNCLGLRRLGILFASISIAIGASLVTLTLLDLLKFPLWAAVIGIGISFMFACFWVLVVSSLWVKAAAFSYAERLLDSANFAGPS